MSYQQPDFFRFGFDSLWLVETIRNYNLSSINSILEIGAGSGVISCELGNIFSNAHFTCIELQEAFSPYLNNNLNTMLGTRFNLFFTSVKDFNLNSSLKFDLIVFNPPYFESQSSRPSPIEEREICRKHIINSWSDWMDCVERSLAPSGIAIWVHRMARMGSGKLKIEQIAEQGDLGVWSARRLNIE